MEWASGLQGVLNKQESLDLLVGEYELLLQIVN